MLWMGIYPVDSAIHLSNNDIVTFMRQMINMIIIVRHIRQSLLKFISLTASVLDVIVPFEIETKNGT